MFVYLYYTYPNEKTNFAIVYLNQLSYRGPSFLAPRRPSRPAKRPEVHLGTWCRNPFPRIFSCGNDE